MTCRAREREDQGDVDADAVGDQGGDRGKSLGGRGHLDEDVAARHGGMQSPRLGDRGGGVVGQLRADLEADAPVAAPGALPDGGQSVARHLDVLDRQRLEQRGTLEPVGDAGGERIVIVGALGDRELEDGGVRGHADDAGVAHQPVEFARDQVAAADEVEPHALAQLEEPLRTNAHR
jgi:hypothetical protein